ncbi:cell adhesion molecule 2-like [Pseudomyrmex gracilis]|uniref:cell adhesion molecule 2-like n=1 Tax=Pseudomyrmex gracilis TaxID=219809 RepID=UPI000994F1E1|nr:cell adhesion molecule 2-like [Pseudomyrmex gracilis]XP_020287760.1 cell adhesion molecule 2-like [Pseudomyrmex gracilis]
MDFALVLLVMLLRQEVAALKLLHIKVPPYTLRGKDATLECRYDVEADNLYGVTWYKDNEQFYKYEDKGNPKKHRTFDVAGVKVNSNLSDSQQVTLEHVNFNSSGTYKCEVNAEAPSFNSVSDQAEMEVIAPPKKRPAITGEEKVYATGDVLALNCTSDKSRPAARLEWFVNGEQVRENVPSITLKDDAGLYLTVSSLLLGLEPGHLTHDKINVRCKATVQSSLNIDDPFVDTRETQVFVQGLASLTSPSLCLLIAALLQQRFLLPV